MGRVSQFRFVDGADVWDQQDGESDKAFAAFVAFLELPRPRDRENKPLSRRVTDVVSSGGVVGWSLRHVQRVAREHHWEDRAFAWEVAQSELLRGRMVDAKMRVVSSRLDLLEELSGVALEVLRSKDPEDWRPRDFLELLKTKWMAEDALVGVQGANFAGGGSVSAGVSLALGSGGGADGVDGELEEVIAELLSRRRPVGVVEGDVGELEAGSGSGSGGV
jgi:hypothetical protein